MAVFYFAGIKEKAITAHQDSLTGTVEFSPIGELEIIRFQTLTKIKLSSIFCEKAISICKPMSQRMKPEGVESDKLIFELSLLNVNLSFCRINFTSERVDVLPRGMNDVDQLNTAVSASEKNVGNRND
jgi:hypothetical protein